MQSKVQLHLTPSRDGCQRSGPGFPHESAQEEKQSRGANDLTCSPAVVPLGRSQKSIQPRNNNNAPYPAHFCLLGATSQADALRWTSALDLHARYCNAGCGRQLNLDIVCALQEVCWAPNPELHHPGSAFCTTAPPSLGLILWASPSHMPPAAFPLLEPVVQVLRIRHRCANCRSSPARHNNPQCRPTTRSPGGVPLPLRGRSSRVRLPALLGLVVCTPANHVG